VQIITYFEGGQADLVVCDGAPDGQLALLLYSALEFFLTRVRHPNKIWLI